jgi:hypothetical protein
MLNEAIYKVKGTSAMLMHNAQLANPLNDWSRAIKKISGKRKKTDEDHIEMARLEFLGGLYWNGKAFVVPSSNWESALTEGAKKVKMGKAIKSAIFINEDSVLSFDGPKTPDDRWAVPACRDQRSAKVGTARVIRTRPLFTGWSCEIKVMFDPELIDRSAIDGIFDITGRQIGIGDYRPKFGRFEVVK